VRQASVLNECAEKHAHGGEQQPWVTFEQLNDAQADKEGKQCKNENCRGKFHRLNSSPAYSECKQFAAGPGAQESSLVLLGFTLANFGRPADPWGGTTRSAEDTVAISWKDERYSVHGQMRNWFDLV